MCDFHSCVIRADGSIFHLPCNSHTTIIDKCKLNDNTQAFRQKVWEWEWDGVGQIPDDDGLRSDGNETPAVKLAARRHARALNTAMTTGVLAPVFKGHHYSDVRRRVKDLLSCSKSKLSFSQIYALARKGANYRALLAKNTSIPLAAWSHMARIYTFDNVVQMAFTNKTLAANKAKAKPVRKVRRKFALTKSGKRSHYSPLYGR